MQGWLLFAARREKEEDARQLDINFLAARGDQASVTKRLKGLTE